MDEIDYNDAVLDDFITRMGVDTIKTQKKGVDTSIFKKPENKLVDVPLQSEIQKASLTDKVSAGLESVGGVGGAADMALGAVDLVNSATGKSYDTSAETGSVGSEGGAILGGAAKGAQMGQALGPWGMAIGAVVGGAAGYAGRSKAAKELHTNRKRHNLKENALEKAENEEAYRMEQGQESLGLLKDLRKKQLGMIK